MQLAAIFEIEPAQERWFRDRLPRLAEEINHGGMQIYVTPEPVAAPVAEPEAAPTAEIEPPLVLAAADEPVIDQPAAEVPAEPEVEAGDEPEIAETQDSPVEPALVATP